MTLKLTVREANVQKESDNLIDLLVRNFADWRANTTAKFEWLYLTNPFGSARAWVLESAGGRFVGLSAAFPRRLRIGDTGALDAWVLGDFCVAQEYRSLGPALQLQQAISAVVDRGETDVWYDFPSQPMQAIYRRMGISAGGELVRLVHPLRVDKIVSKRVGSAALAAGVRVVGNAVLEVRDSLRSRDASIEMRACDGEWDVRAIPCVGLSTGIFLDRTPEYLHWRLRRDPRGPSEILSAWRDGSCGGAIAVRAQGDNHAIVDAFGIREKVFLRELVLEVVERARDASAVSVSVGLSTEHPWTRVLEELGFHQRERVPYAFYARQERVPAGVPWLLTSGDRDE